MQVGDLVKCSANGWPSALGVVVSINNRAVGAAVVVVLAHNNEKCYFQWQHLEVINEGR